MPIRNPYHFIPALKDMPHVLDAPAKEPLTEKGLHQCTHDRYHENTLSGRVVCVLKTCGPVVIGGCQTVGDSGYRRVHPYLRNGEPAIPSSTLRGCLSAIAEAASNSALRVLHNTYYSRRVSMGEVRDRIEDLSAMGMIVRENGGLRLKPLALPSLKPDTHGGYTVPPRYRIMFPAPTRGTAPETRMKAYCYDGSTLPSPLNAYSDRHRDFCYAKLTGTYTIDNQHRVTGTGGHVTVRGGILLGLDTAEAPQSAPPPGEEHLYKKGMLRALSSVGRNDIPSTKKHEFFVPLCEDLAKIPSFPIQPGALERFHRMAEAREAENERREGTEQDLLPYVPKGAEPLKNRSYRLDDGDIVFFTPDAAGEEVAAVWISQIWREEIPQSAFDFFAEISPELLPFSGTRTKITPAEALFGFVEEKADEGDSDGRALASRVRFSDALLLNPGPDGAIEPNPKKLRILSSPKPPCPPLYFRKRSLRDKPTASDCYISKRDLNASQHMPQGRKFYLNHEIDGGLERRYCTSRNHENENQSQKSIVNPIRKDCEFAFHIDFDNLTNWELGLLLYAVRPADTFHHKIGMGKPLGLGTVSIQIAGIFYVNRATRYSAPGFVENGSFCARYSEYWVNPDHTGKDALRSEIQLCARGQRPVSDNSPLAPGSVLGTFTSDIPEPIRKAIIKIGQPGIRDVRTPLEHGQDPEEETFRWFQNNDHHKMTTSERQGLVPLEYGDQMAIPVLNENTRPVAPDSLRQGRPRPGRR